MVESGGREKLGLRRLLIVPLLVVVAGSLVSVFAARRAEDGLDEQRIQEYTRDAEIVEILLQERVDDYVEVLNSLNALFLGSEEVTRAEFNSYVLGSQILDRYSGMQSLQFVRALAQEDISDYETSVRSDRSVTRLGYPEFSVHPAGVGEVLVAEFVEPIDGNQLFLGANYAANDRFRSYIESARDTGELTASLPGLSPVEQGEEGDFYLFLALYKGKDSPASIAERRDSFEGVLVGAFKAPAMIAQMLPEHPAILTIWDSGIAAGASSDLSPVVSATFSEGLSGDELQPLAKGSEPPVTQSIAVANRTWQLDVVPLAGAASRVRTETSAVILVVGLLVTGILAVLMFVSASSRQRAESLARGMTKSLRQSEARARGIVRNAGDAIIGVAHDGSISSFNTAAVHMFERAKDETVGRPVTMLLADGYKDVHDNFTRARTEGSEGPDFSADLRVTALRRDGEMFPAQLTVGSLEEDDGQTSVWIIRDIAEQVELQDRLIHIAEHDDLTGLENRATILRRISHALTRSRGTYDGMAVIYMDLDKFKNVNDSRGHEAGDMLLVQVVDRLMPGFRETDSFGRVGGDEFVIVAEDLDSIDGAVSLASRVIDLVARPFFLDGQEVSIGASVGICYVDAGDASPDRVLREADTAMYKAKEHGRGRYQIYDESMQAYADWRSQIEKALQNAISANEFELFYQPLVNVATGALIGFEALIRWHRSGIGMVSPDDFIPIAEESGFIIDIGDWVMNEACRQVVAWDLAGKPVPVSINVSGLQLSQSDFVAKTASALARHGVRPNLVVLEITESFLLSDVDSAVETIRSLKELGLRIAIDDFGTGYSSLTYLRKFPVDILKVDRSFVSRIGESEEDASIVAMIVSLGQALDLQVTAEGVEDRDQLAMLQHLGCATAQGYYFARPMPLNEIARWWDDHETLHTGPSGFEKPLANGSVPTPSRQLAQLEATQS